MEAPGQSLGHYRIVARLGAGGMGEVWRATDTRLGRNVAIKVLPAAFASDPMRMARFTREAQVLASLNHPGIASIYGVEQNALVMELVEGPTLAERIAKGPIPFDEALPIATQIAEALEYAHERGVVHRDLKPANIKITPDGRVKILDFGLAKAASADDTSSSAELPTLSSPATLVGTVLGTAAYMAPEQARGKPVDRRADIWAFGVVLYEMLMGKRPFEGEDVTETLAAVVKTEPDLAPLPEPAHAVIARCLQKDPRQRLSWIGEACYALQQPVPVAVARTAGDAPGRRIWTAWAIVTLAVAAACVAATWRLRAPAPGVVSRLEFALPDGQSFPSAFWPMLAIAPNGSKIVYVANQQLYVRALDQLEPQAIPGTDENPTGPVISPDGQWVAYAVNGWLRKVPLAGGSPVTLCGLPSFPYGMSWRGHTIVFAENGGAHRGIMAVTDSGGTPRLLAAVDSAEGFVNWPQLLDDGRRVLFGITPLGAGDAGQIVVQGLDGSGRRVLLNGGVDPVLLPIGVLLYMHGGTLFGVPFDTRRLQVTGSPVPMLEGVNEDVSTLAGHYAVARNGILVYRPGSLAASQDVMVYVDRQGHEEPIAAPPRAYEYPRVSPDGARVAVTALDESNDVWIWDFGHQTLSRLTFGNATSYGSTAFLYPTWMPDGQHVLFGLGQVAASGSAMFRKAADGTGSTEVLLKPGTGGDPQAISQDGKWLVFRTTHRPYNLHLFPLNGGVPSLLLADTNFTQDNASLSPDGRWIAYQSNESGRDEIYVRPFPAVAGGRWQVSTGGGTRPVWARNGRELFYMEAASGAPPRLMAVATPPGPNFRFGAPQPLFPLTGYDPGNVGTNFDATPDGRFVMLKPAGGATATSGRTLVVINNWFNEVRARVH